MSKFSELQQQFQRYLLDENLDFAHQIVETPIVSKTTRLNIYKNAYRLRLQEALTASYPALKIHLGEKRFTNLCLKYIEKSPSNYRSIRWFGDQLPAFLKTHNTYKKIPVLFELANWEWINTLVFDAQNSAKIDLADMAAIAPEKWAEVKFKLQSAARCVNFKWNAVEIWQSITEQKPAIQAAKSAKIKPWLIWRNDLTCQYIALPDDEAYAINAVIQGQTFGEICVGLCDFVDETEAATRAAYFLKNWIVSGLITEIYF